MWLALWFWESWKYSGILEADIKYKQRLGIGIWLNELLKAMDNERIGSYEVFAMTGNLVKLIIKKVFPCKNNQYQLIAISEEIM